MNVYIIENKRWILGHNGMPGFSGRRRRICFQLLDPEVSETDQLCDSNAIDNAMDRIRQGLAENR